MFFPCYSMSQFWLQNVWRRTLFTSRNSYASSTVIQLIWVLSQSGQQLNWVWVLLLLQITSMHHTLQNSSTCGLQLPCFLSVLGCQYSCPPPPAATAAFSSLCTSTTEGVSLCTLAPSPSIRVRLLIRASLMASLSFWAGLSLRQVLRGGNFSVFLHPCPPDVNQTLPCMRENISGEGESFMPCPQWREMSAWCQCRVPCPSRVADRFCFYSSFKSGGYLPEPGDKRRGQKSFLLFLRVLSILLCMK